MRLIYVLLMCLIAMPAWADGVHLSIEPRSFRVEPGQQFDIEVHVPIAGLQFNGVGAVIGYDPQAIEWVPMPRDFQELPWLPGICGFTFYHVYQDDSPPTTPLTGAVSILMCNQRLETGPGSLFRFRFRALNVVTATQLTLLRPNICCDGSNQLGTAFYDGSQPGVRIGPLHLYDASVGIGMDPGATAAVEGTATSYLRAVSTGSRVVFSAMSEGSGRITIHDISGRLVKVLSGGTGIWQAEWRAERAGVYIASMGKHRARFVVIP
ncbi:MAG: hypothetical protein ACRDGM_10800 [bacterium]